MRHLLSVCHLTARHHTLRIAALANRGAIWLGLIAWFALAGSVGLPGLEQAARADESNGRCDLYFIDVEGGAAVLMVTATGESLLVDSGYPDHQYRDRDRILRVLKLAGRKQLDHAAVSHWHLDHYGNHAALAAEFPVKNFWDRGMPERLSEDPQYGERIEKYRAAAQNKSRPLKVGDTIPLKSSQTPLKLTVVTASGEVLPNQGVANPFAGEHKPQPEDPSDNAKSMSFLVEFGKFRFLTCGDLTWNTEAKLMTPNNPIGQIDLFMVTHHGLNVSNNPVLVLPLDPVVAVMCNGPEKGGAAETQATLKRVKSLKSLFQLHRNIKLKAEEQAPAEFIANDYLTESCPGRFVKVSVAADSRSYTVQVEGQEKVHTYQTRVQ